MPADPAPFRSVMTALTGGTLDAKKALAMIAAALRVSFIDSLLGSSSTCFGIVEVAIL